MLKSAVTTFLRSVSLFVVFVPGAATAEKPPASYTPECVLRSGCDFACVAPAGVKSERVFEKSNVKTVDFIEFNGAAIATIFVSNEQPTTFRLSGTVFCEMANSLVR